MKFTVEGAEFKQHLQEVSRVVNTKNPLQILENLLFEVKNGVLYITGSDTENTLQVEMPLVDCEGEGDVCLNTRMLLDITKEISSQPIHFVVDENTGTVDVNYHNGEFQFMGISGSEYPRPKDNSENEETYRLVLPAEVVKKGIDNTIYACSKETIRPAMTGIFWDIHNEDITFVGSDTHTLVRYINSEVAPCVETSFIMASKPANVLSNIIDKLDTEINLTVNGRNACFELPGRKLICQFINGNYPNYARVIPQDNPNRMVVERQALLSALRRVSIFASKASALIRFDIEAGQLVLSGSDMDFATSSEERVMCEYEGEKMAIGFNADYTLQIIQNIEGEKVVIELADRSRPGVFRPEENKENEDLIVIQMPMQVIDRY